MLPYSYLSRFTCIAFHFFPACFFLPLALLLPHFLFTALIYFSSRSSILYFFKLFPSLWLCFSHFSSSNSSFPPTTTHSSLPHTSGFPFSSLHPSHPLYFKVTFFSASTLLRFLVLSLYLSVPLPYINLFFYIFISISHP